MNTRLMSILVVVVVLTFILLTGYQRVVAAPPTGELKTAAAVLGNEVPNPFRETTHSGDWMQLLYDHLVGTTPTGELSPALGLAHKWEMTPDGLIWTFYLRKGVKFHDGMEVTSKDVKFSIDQQLLPESTVASALILKQMAKSVEVKDPYTVVVHCKTPSIFLPYFLSNLEGPTGMVVPKDYYERVGVDSFARRPIGSGPYKWHSQQVGSFIKLEATEKHWRDGVPKYKYMTYLAVPEESTRMAMLKTGEVDITDVSRERAKETLDAGLQLLTKEGWAVLNYVLNMQWVSPAFSDIRFRKALNLAIDKEVIIKQLLGGLAKPVATWPGSDIAGVGGDPKLKPYPYDPQEARRLIKEGGWEGYEFPLVTYARSGFSELPRIHEAVAGYWEKVGLKPKIRITEWAVWRKAWRSRKCENMIHGHDSSTTPGIPNLIRGFTQRYEFKMEESSVNIPYLNERFERIDKSLNIAEISKLMAEIYQYAYDHYLTVPICELSELTATTKKIAKWDLGHRRQSRNYYDLIKQR